MPTYRITGPDGATYKVTAPDGANEQDVLSYVQSQSKPQQPQSMSWGEAAATGVSNIPASAARFGQSIYDAVTSPVETAKNLAKVGYGGLSKAAGAAGVPMDPEAKAVREQEFDAVTGFFKDRYGGAENIKRTLAEDPVGMAADAASLLSGFGSAMRAPAISRAATFVDPVNATMKATKFAGNNIVAPAIGLTTGVGSDAVRAAGRAGYQGNRAFIDNMRGTAPLDGTINMAKSALGQMRQERGNAYRAGMEAVKSSDTPISYGPIAKAMADAHGRSHFRGVPIDEAAAKTLDDIRTKVGQFQEIAKAGPADVSYRAAEGLDALKQALGEIRQRTQPGTLARNVADHVYNTTKGEITRQVPEYASVMKGYSQASDEINDLAKTFSLSEKASRDTIARKLQSVMRNNVNTNYGQRTRKMETLARYEPDLPAALAGQAMSSGTPRGLQSLAASVIGVGGAGNTMGVGIVNPAMMAALPFMSPRLMGEAAYGTGTAARMLDSMSRRTGLSKEQLAQILLGTRAAGELGQAAEPASQ